MTSEEHFTERELTAAEAHAHLWGIPVHDGRNWRLEHQLAVDELAKEMAAAAGAEVNWVGWNRAKEEWLGRAVVRAAEVAGVGWDPVKQEWMGGG